MLLQGSDSSERTYPLYRGTFHASRSLERRNLGKTYPLRSRRSLHDRSRSIYYIRFYRGKDPRHRNLRGILPCILAFARYLDEKKIPMWIRHVVVPQVTDSEIYLRKLGEFMATLSNVKALDVLPYHILGTNKYKELGIEYPLEGIKATTREAAIEAKGIILNAFRETRQKMNQAK